MLKSDAICTEMVVDRKLIEIEAKTDEILFLNGDLVDKELGWPIIMHMDLCWWVIILIQLYLYTWPRQKKFMVVSLVHVTLFSMLFLSAASIPDKGRKGNSSSTNKHKINKWIPQPQLFGKPYMLWFITLYRLSNRYHHYFLVRRMAMIDDDNEELLKGEWKIRCYTTLLICIKKWWNNYLCKANMWHWFVKWSNYEQ